MIEKLRVLYELARSKTYAIALDNNAYISIPLADIESFDNILLVSGQSKALATMRDKLSELITLHDERIKELSQEA